MACRDLLKYPLCIVAQPAEPKRRDEFFWRGEINKATAVIGMAAQTNALVTAMQVPVDEAFQVT
ncbi:hypothetical protein ACLSYI_04380 [Bordetella avium]|uniref:hypothetical protein n=1 Tax=Bordetella avium TaxID=521 RepID=UPI003BF8EE1C